MTHVSAGPHISVGSHISTAPQSSLAIRGQVLDPPRDSSLLAPTLASLCEYSGLCLDSASTRGDVGLELKTVSCAAVTRGDGGNVGDGRDDGYHSIAIITGEDIGAREAC